MLCVRQGQIDVVRATGTDRDALKAQFEAHVNAKSEAAAQVVDRAGGRGTSHTDGDGLGRDRDRQTDREDKTSIAISRPVRSLRAEGETGRGRWGELQGRGRGGGRGGWQFDMCSCVAFPLRNLLERHPTSCLRVCACGSCACRSRLKASAPRSRPIAVSFVYSPRILRPSRLPLPPPALAGSSTRSRRQEEV